MSVYFSEKFSVPAQMDHIAAAIDHLRRTLIKIDVKRQEISKFCLRAEEVLVLLVKNADGKSPITISISSFLGTSTVKMNCSGSAFTIDDFDSQLLESTDDAEAKEILERLLNKVITKQIRVQHRKGVTVCKLNVQESSAKAIYRLLLAMLGGAIFSYILQNFFPTYMAGYILKNLVEPVDVIFINVLRTIIGPLVFFSIANSVAGFSDLRSLGRVAIKTLGLYSLTSIMALFVGYLAFQILPAGTPSLQSAVVVGGASALPPAKQGTLSLGQSLISLFPNNFLRPFLEMNMLQIIFLGLLVGIACIRLRERDNFLAKFIYNCSTLLITIVTIVVSTMPVVVFCSTCKLVSNVDMAAMADMVTFVLCSYLELAICLGGYSMILLLVRYSPVAFFKKFLPAIVTAFTTSSSNVTIPVSLKACTERVGIHPKVASFSIPLGATINMDATCAFMVMSLFFMARIYNIVIPTEQYFSLGLTIFMLSIGSPGVYGGPLIYIAGMLPVIGVPMEAISLILVINAFVDRCQTVGNVVGDAVVSVVVAHSEGMLDRNK